MLRCPKCGSLRVAAETRTWINYGGPGEEPYFDEEDGPFCEPVPGGIAICRVCQGQWTVPDAPGPRAD